MNSTAPTQSPAAALTLDELLRHNEEESERWRQWFQQHEDALNLPLDIAEMKDVRGTLLHIFAVELVYSERIMGIQRQRLAWEDFPSGSTAELFDMGAAARHRFREFLDSATDDTLRETITLGRGDVSLSATKRKAFVHAMLHSMRHWAQLATVLRQQGLKQDWGHDFIFTKVIP